MPLTAAEEIELHALLEAEAAALDAVAAAAHAVRERERLETERAAILERCKTLHGFIEEFWYVLEPRAPFVTGWAVRAMCDHLEAVHYGHIQNLLINVPPGMMKSLLVSVFFQAWEWGPMGRPDLRYLATSFSEKNVLRDSNKVRKLVESEKFQRLWGDKVTPSAKWGERWFENTEGGLRDCRPFAKLTGGRGDRVLIDDPHSVDGAESDAVREGTVQTFREGSTDRLNDLSKSATIVIMQRLHEADISGTILKIDPTFVHLMLPMEFDPKRKCATVLRPANDGNPAIIFEDIRTKAGELLFPERFSAEAIQRQKTLKGSYAYSGQYQQEPTPRSGGLFQRSWFRPIRALPAQIIKKVRAWDIGATEGGGDPSAGVAACMDADGRCFFTDCINEQMSPARLEATMQITAAADGPDVTIRIPQDPGAAGKGYARTLINKLVGYPVVSQQPTGDKVTRATALSAQAEVGNVYVLTTGDPERDAWIEPFVHQLSQFPKGTHDDMVDAAADAFNELALGAGPVTASPLSL